MTRLGFRVLGGDTEMERKVTMRLFFICIMASTGGLMLGYENGVSGGLTSMPDFLKTFFPVVYRRTSDSSANSKNHCMYYNPKLQLFTPSFYLAGLFATLFASHPTRKLGRRPIMFVAGIVFTTGVAMNFVVSTVMLIMGRILRGVAVGLANQAVPLFLSEMAPARFRGSLNILFQLNVTTGIFLANLVNYTTAKINGGWGWKVSLNLAFVFGVFLTLGSLMVEETPTSLIERGLMNEGKSVLMKIRGTDNVEQEFLGLVEASRASEEVTSPFRNLVKRNNLPQLIITIILQLSQQFTGINAILFYAPMLFETLGFGRDASLFSAVIIGAVNVVSTMVTIFSVDRIGRRKLLLEAGVQMFVSHLVIATIFMVTNYSDKLSKGTASSVVVFICLFVAGFAWSWGPLGWLIPSEIFPLETRSAGQSVSVCANFLFTYVIAQSFLPMLCHFKNGIFLFFAGCMALMSAFVYFLLPETKSVRVEDMNEKVWKQHRVWKRFMEEDFSTSEII